MADYAEMKEKLRRDGMAEQKAKFNSTAGTPAQTSMRYGSMTDAEEKAAAAKPTPMFESAQPSEAKAPTATVRGVPDEMMAEYYAPANKAEPASPQASGPSPAEAAAARLRGASAEFGRMNDIMDFYVGAGAATGAAVGAGLGGPPGAVIGGGLGGVGGAFLGDKAMGNETVGKEGPGNWLTKYEVAERELEAARRAIAAGLRDGTFTKEEIEAAIKQSRQKK